MSSLPEIGQQFKNFLTSVNHPVIGDINFDSGWQSYQCPESKNSKTSARYRAHSDGTPTLIFNCHRCGVKENYSYKCHPQEYKLDTTRQHPQGNRVEKDRLKAESYKKAFESMNQLWDDSKPCENHPYFDLKQVTISETEGFRVTTDGTLLCPIRNVSGELISIQRIYWNSGEGRFEKRFFKGLSPKHGFHLLGKLEADRKIYFAEGIATSLTIHKATDRPTICVYGKHFSEIAPLILDAYPNTKFVFCCDIPSENEKVTSEGDAQNAISNTGGVVCLPDFSRISKSLRPEIPRSDFNDLSMLLLAKGLSRAQAHEVIYRQLSFEPIAHIEILTQLTSKIEPVDFRSIVDITADKRLQNNHYQIIVVEQILKLAQRHKWGICRNHDFIYLYNGTCWNVVSADELKTFLGQAAERMGVDKYKALYFNFRDQLLKQFIALSNLPKPDHPREKVYINLKNGTFEITPSGNRLRDFEQSNFITYQLPFEYDPEAKATLFFKYLNRVLPDKERQAILSEYLGYVFIRTSTLKLEKTLLLYGTGANGKSVFYEIVRSLFGAHNTSEYSLQSLTDDKGYYRAMIANKLVNYASEINGKLEASIFKQLVSGEPVEARLPYGNPFTLTEYAKLIFNCNDLPKDVEQTEAFFRRFIIIPFEVTIPESEQDKQLAQKIIANELSGVFNWVLNGLQRLLVQKQFTHCEAVQRAREQYERESDSVKLFIDEMGYRSSSVGYVQIKILYIEYRVFCSEAGYKPVNKTNCIRRLTNSGFFVERKNHGNIVWITKTGMT